MYTTSIRDRFWSIIQGQLNSHNLRLSHKCESLLRDLINRGVSVLTARSASAQEINGAEQNLQLYIQEMISQGNQERGFPERNEIVTSTEKYEPDEIYGVTGSVSEDAGIEEADTSDYTVTGDAGIEEAGTSDFAVVGGAERYELNETTFYAAQNLLCPLWPFC